MQEMDSGRAHMAIAVVVCGRLIGLILTTNNNHGRLEARDSVWTTWPAGLI